MMMLYVVIYSGAKTAEKGMLGLRSTRRVANSQNDCNLESKRTLREHILNSYKPCYYMNEPIKLGCSRISFYNL